VGDAIARVGEEAVREAFGADVEAWFTHAPLPLAGGVGGGAVATAKPYRDKAGRRPTARSRELRGNPTEAEQRLWARLSARQVANTRFNRQFPIGPFICDFAARTAKLVIELDGGQHADREEVDARRTDYLRSRGYRVVRFWNNDVLGNIDGVVQAIERILVTAPPPTPPASGRGDK
jgi:very-short-patch-repair endonuclease